MQVSDKRRAPVAEAAGRPSSSAPELRLPRAGERHAGVRGRLWQVVRAVGALSLLAVGAVHLQQYLYLYSAIPTIGTLFVLNFVGATAIGLGLLAPVEYEGEIKVRERLTLTLSVDHRALDGAAGARYLQALKALLEKPMLLLV